MTTYTRKCRRYGSKKKRQYSFKYKNLKLLNTKKVGGSSPERKSALDIKKTKMNDLRGIAVKLDAIAQHYHHPDYIRDKKKYGEYNSNNLSNAGVNTQASIKAISLRIQRLAELFDYSSDRAKEAYPVERIDRFNRILSRITLETPPREISKIWDDHNFFQLIPWESDNIQYVTEHTLTPYRNASVRSNSPFHRWETREISAEFGRRRKNREDRKKSPEMKSSKDVEPENTLLKNVLDDCETPSNGLSPNSKQRVNRLMFFCKKTKEEAIQEVKSKRPRSRSASS